MSISDILNNFILSDIFCTGISPVDNKFFELIIPIATFLTGTLSGIMLAGEDKELRGKAMEAATKPPTPPAPKVVPGVPPTNPIDPGSKPSIPVVSVPKVSVTLNSGS